MDQTPAYDLDPMCSSQHTSAIAALRLLRSYNHFVVPPDSHPMVPLLAALPSPSCLPQYCQHILPVRPPLTNTQVPVCDNDRRRGEKRPIPAELKDEKYFERRRRNNQAAKKSRDARRMREDQVSVKSRFIAWRACLLEQENASLRAHITALRQEAMALRALLAARDEAPMPSSTTD
ncbi:cell death specification protein 2-like [Zerene cesonia]|uniref:cell death specification protein 2-like n=1 Tax=Zerene cesonia TaxID=33412 RepID=UPI0018E546C9|nr:cell death specification protein 2-like [Zerene cesonia]